jgi:transposase
VAHAAGAFPTLEQRPETLRPLSKAGVFEAFFDTFASMSSTTHLIEMFDSTIVRAHLSAAGAKGAKTRRRSDGHAAASPRKSTPSRTRGATSSLSILTGGEAADAPHFETFLDIDPGIQPRAAICDKGYAGQASCAAARARGFAPVIPHKTNEKDRPKFLARMLYKAHACIEQGIGRIKRFKHFALRCEKAARNIRSIVSFGGSPVPDQIRPHGTSEKQFFQLRFGLWGVRHRASPRLIEGCIAALSVGVHRYGVPQI